MVPVNPRTKSKIKLLEIKSNLTFLLIQTIERIIKATKTLKKAIKEGLYLSKDNSMKENAEPKSNTNIDRDNHLPHIGTLG